MKNMIPPIMMVFSFLRTKIPTLSINKMIPFFLFVSFLEEDCKTGRKDRTEGTKVIETTNAKKIPRPEKSPKSLIISKYAPKIKAAKPTIVVTEANKTGIEISPKAFLDCSTLFSFDTTLSLNLFITWML